MKKLIVLIALGLSACSVSKKTSLKEGNCAQLIDPEPPDQLEKWERSPRMGLSLDKIVKTGKYYNLVEQYVFDDGIWKFVGTGLRSIDESNTMSRVECPEEVLKK